MSEHRASNLTGTKRRAKVHASAEAHSGGGRPFAIMASKLYDALRSAGAEESKARGAATAIADFEARIIGIDAKITGLDSKLAALYTHVSQLTWMVGIDIALATGVMFELLAE